MARAISFATPKIALSLRRRKVTRKQLSLFCRQLSVMLNAGIPLLQALTVLYEQSESKLLKEALYGICILLEGGQSFSISLAKYPEIFPEIMVTMVRAGEAGGVLGNILASVSDFLEWEHQIREKVKAAVTYPAVVLGVSLLAVNLMVIFILPVFGRILAQMHAEVPEITRMILGISNFLRLNWHFILGMLIGSVIFFLQGPKRSDRVREVVDMITLRLPVIGHLIKKVIISRFCKTMATLLSVGIPLLAALEIVETTTGNIVVEKSIARSRNTIFDGQGMAAPLQETGVFSSVVIAMITVGEETGTLEVMLQKAGEFYDEEVESYSEKLSAIIEPLLICVVGGVVCVVLLSVFLPMFKVVGTVG